MKLRNPCRKLSSSSPAITGGQLVSRWKSNAKRSSRSTKSNHLAIACRAFRLMVRTRRRLFKLAPLLFDSNAVKNEVNHRLKHLSDKFHAEENIVAETGKLSPWTDNWKFLADDPDPIARAERKFREEMALETWHRLSPDKLAELHAQWEIATLAQTVAFRSWRVSKITTDKSTVTLPQITGMFADLTWT